jgi:hypothetical protein
MSVETVKILSSQYMASNGIPPPRICSMPQGFEGYVYDGLDFAIERDFCLFAVTILHSIFLFMN